VPRGKANRSDRGSDAERGRWLGGGLAFLTAIGWAPRDAAAFVAASVGAMAILVNALFFQTGPHPAPLLKVSLLPAPGAEATNSVAVPRPRPPEAGPPAKSEAPKSATASAPAQAAGGAHGDAIADLLSTRRVIALQKALAQYGYGQIKPTGVVDAETRAAIEKFERERKLPVTGQPSERVARELTGLIGRPLD
jgi:Putative peptidoglycan binding domain